MGAQPILQVFANGEFVPANKALLHISDLAIQRGYGVFDFFKVEQNEPLFLDDYLERFYNSASLMYLKVPYSVAELQQILQKLISINNLELSGVKMILTGGYSENGFEPGTPNLIIQQQPLVLPTQAQIEQGINIITHEYLRDIPVAKTINYTTGIRLLQHMRENKADDVLYHGNGIITEFPRCNFFMVSQNDTVITPTNNILKGITRKNVLHLAAKKYKVEQRDILLEEVMQAKEAFLTSTTKRILPIVRINQKEIGDGRPGVISKTLLHDLVDLEKSLLSSSGL
jgi:branched-chain amino acid aminotransferase